MTKLHIIWYPRSFNTVNFRLGAQFSHTKFIQEATFVDTIFGLCSRFNYVVFRDPENVNFQNNNLSHVSFMNTDISRVRFGETALGFERSPRVGVCL
jgi:uncharacterized protein YjbI with pentapeptide repeats